MEFDHAHGLQARRWPSIATEWIHRERRYEWPSPSVVKKIIDNGCHVVAKGDPDSPNEDCLWLVPFALAERTLVHTFNHTQFLIYNFLKLVLKRMIDVSEPDIITSYFIKTIIFYCIENTDNAMWDSELLDVCYCKCITTLYLFVEEMYCPNYFVKENNMFKRKINSINRPRVLSLLQWLLHLGIEGVLYHIKERSVLGMQITPTLTELRSDAEFLHGGTYRWLALDIVKISRSTSVTTDTCNRFLRTFQNLVLDNAILHMTQEEANGISLLLFRLASIVMAEKLPSLFQHQSMSNRNYYKIRRLIERFRRHGFHYDLSFGRLRAATYFYKTGLMDKCLKLTQEMMSTLAPYALIEGCEIDTDWFFMFKNEFCGKNVLTVEKFKRGFARVVEFYPDEYTVELPVKILMCKGDKLGCLEPVAIDPLVYAYYLQGLCFVQKQDQLALDRSVVMLKERLESNCIKPEAVTDQLSKGYSLLGRLELLRDRPTIAARYFVKSYLFWEKFKETVPVLKYETINFALLNLGTAINRLLGI